jgi:CheY-like chemotaxis protein/anti-sigma regulatory factor (Ser/Thr protein kinase)
MNIPKYAQILNRSQTWGDKERQGINIIHQCGTHLLMLINDVLDLSKIEARKLELHPTTFCFPAFLQAIVEIIRIRADQKSIDLFYCPDPKLPEGVEADEKRLRQVLINLLGNAVKFTDKGSVTFKVELVTSQDENNQVSSSFSRIRFQIADTGVGIDPDAIAKLFMPFEQFGNTKRQAEGTGLGLAISQKIVNLMDSQIQVRSQLGSGSTFYFDVNLPIAVEWRRSATTKTGQHIINYQGERKTLLIIDDKWENRSVLVNLLEPIGFRVIEAEDGADGLAKATQLKPHLIITDLLMPVMDGYELLQRLRSLETLKTIPVIVSSASVSEIDRQQSLEAGGDDFLTKPVQAEDLFQILEKYLELEWNYEETLSVSHSRTFRENPSDQIDNSSPEMMTPAPEDLMQLLSLVQQGRLKKMTEEVKRIEKLDERYVPFVQQILQLAQEFQIRKIETLIQDYMSQKDESNKEKTKRSTEL